MRIRYTIRAGDDLDRIFRYLDDHSPAGALSVKSEITRRISLLADIPDLAPRSRSIAGVLELTVTQHPYKVFYTIESGEVVILHVRHAARRPWTGA